ncbi:MAG: hypothetical protein AAF203_01565 [Pseudomonadota bacterium]
MQFLGMIFCIVFFSTMLKAKEAKTEAPKLNNFVGEWDLAQGPQKVCPDRVVIKNPKKGEVVLQNIRATAQATIRYQVGAVLTQSEKRIYVGDKSKEDDKGYTLVTNYNTSVVNGRLVSNHLWSGVDESWSSTGTKIFGMKNSKTLVLEKAITGYFDQEEDKEYKDVEKKRAKHFEHQAYGLRSSVFECEFTKSKNVAKK